MLKRINVASAFHFRYVEELRALHIELRMENTQKNVLLLCIA